jgi:hypothetical protein
MAIEYASFGEDGIGRRDIPEGCPPEFREKILAARVREERAGKVYGAAALGKEHQVQTDAEWRREAAERLNKILMQ